MTIEELREHLQRQITDLETLQPHLCAFKTFISGQ